MKSSDSLDDVLKRYPKYLGFIDSVEKSVDWIYSIVNDYSCEEKINVVSHLADADGFGSQIVFQKGLERILGFLGNTTKTVESERIMSFSNDEKSLSSLKGLIDNWFGEGGKWIISDLASFEPKDANKFLKDALIIDHHRPKKGFDERFNVVNPHLHGIDGGKELSASMISTFIVNRLYERIEFDILADIDSGAYNGKAIKDVRANLVDLRKDLDYISMFGIAGSKADMQEDTGLNRAMYEYFENRGILKRIDSPFFGYYTKSSGKVFAQSGPTFNFKYNVPRPEEFQKGFNQLFNLPSGGRLSDMLTLDGIVTPAGKDKFMFDLYKNFRWAFSIENKGFCINTFYLNSLPDDEIDKFNTLIMEWTGKRAVRIENPGLERELKVAEEFTESEFEVFDDIKVMEKRIQAAESLIRNLGYEPKNPLAFEGRLNMELINKFKDCTIAFGDREDLSRNLEKLYLGQYVPVNGKELANTSIPEIANCMTSMSKLRVGDIFLDGIDEVLSGKCGPNVARVYRKHAEYKLYVHKGMGALEEKILAREGLNELLEGVYFMNVDFLKEIGEDFDIDLRQMNGVFGGISCETNLLPSGKAIFLTGTTFTDDGREYVKISGRATDSIKYDGVRLDKFMRNYDGGGHKTAAACVIDYKKLDDFIESIGKFDFYKGDFR